MCLSWLSHVLHLLGEPRAGAGLPPPGGGLRRCAGPSEHECGGAHLGLHLLAASPRPSGGARSGGRGDRRSHRARLSAVPGGSRRGRRLGAGAGWAGRRQVSPRSAAAWPTTRRPAPRCGHPTFSRSWPRHSGRPAARPTASIAFMRRSNVSNGRSAAGSKPNFIGFECQLRMASPQHRTHRTNAAARLRASRPGIPEANYRPGPSPGRNPLILQAATARLY